MKGEENLFRKGLFVSLGLHLLVVCLLSLGVGRHGEVSPESSIEVSLSTHAPRVDKKKSDVKSPSHPQKPEKSAKKKVKKTPSAQVKTPEKRKEPVATRKETVAEKTAQSTKPETEKEEAAAEENPLDSGKREVIRDIKKESVLRSIEKAGEAASAQPASKKAGPGLISLVLDVYYRTISKRIQRNLILPLNIDSSVFLAAQVNFHMRENGEVYDVGIETSSGNRSFDSYCIKAVDAASPLPPPPNELRDRIKSEFFIISCESKK